MREIVAKGLRYAILRFPESGEIQRLLSNAAIVESDDLGAPLRLAPSGSSTHTVTVIYDRERIESIRRDHRFPEWVVCANVERMVLSQFAQWGLPAPEVERLVAHRERAQRSRRSESGPVDTR